MAILETAFRHSDFINIYKWGKSTQDDKTESDEDQHPVPSEGFWSVNGEKCSSKQVIIDWWNFNGMWSRRGRDPTPGHGEDRKVRIVCKRILYTWNFVGNVQFHSVQCTLQFINLWIERFACWGNISTIWGDSGRELVFVFTNQLWIFKSSSIWNLKYKKWKLNSSL